MNRLEVTYNSDRFTEEMRAEILDYSDKYSDVGFNFKGSAREEFVRWITKHGFKANEDGFYERVSHNENKVSLVETG